jgi:hypothetical protein
VPQESGKNGWIVNGSKKPTSPEQPVPKFDPISFFVAPPLQLAVCVSLALVRNTKSLGSKQSLPAVAAFEFLPMMDPRLPTFQLFNRK